MPSYPMHKAIAFIQRSLEYQAKDDDEVLWAVCDQVESSREIELTLRENLDGAGAVKRYLITVKELE